MEHELEALVAIKFTVPTGLMDLKVMDDARIAGLYDEEVALAGALRTLVHWFGRYYGMDLFAAVLDGMYDDGEPIDPAFAEWMRIRFEKELNARCAPVVA